MSKSIRSNRGRSLLVGATAAIVGSLLTAGTASAALDPLAGGSTTVAPSKAISKALAKAGVPVKPLGKASAGEAGIRFPISGGELASGQARGTIRHSGALRLGRGSEKLVLRRPKVKLGSRNAVTVVVGGDRLKLFKLDTSGATVSQNDFADGAGTEIDGATALLSAAAAKALRATYGLRVRGGTKFGAVQVSAEPESLKVRALGDTTLALDSGTASALEGLGIHVGLVGSATGESDGVAFPITGGRLGVADLAGDITHSGGLSVTSGDVMVELTEFTINIDDDPDLTAIVAGGDRVSILSLDLSGASIDTPGLHVTVAGVKANLTMAAADALNAAFSTTAFSEGLLLGEARVEATVR